MRHCHSQVLILFLHHIALLRSGESCNGLEKHMEMTGEIPAWPVRKIVERYLKQTGPTAVLFLPAFCGPYEISFREKVIQRNDCHAPKAGIWSVITFGAARRGFVHCHRVRRLFLFQSGGPTRTRCLWHAAPAYCRNNTGLGIRLSSYCAATQTPGVHHRSSRNNTYIKSSVNRYHS